MARPPSSADMSSRYHVLELVGEGSFGRVFKGRKKYCGQVVALKFIPKVGRSEKELRSLRREIEIMRGLKHPNIVQLFDSFETETEVVVVTEYAEGELFQILEDDGHLPESQVHEIACQLVSALYYLHSHRILHRDMKPQNILLGKCGVVKLCDFGFARAMSVSTLVLTSIKGTPLYMAPELVEEKPYDHTADLWSLGCILYELHTGAPPFYTNSIFELVQLIVRDPVKWPDTMSNTCKSLLKGLLTKDAQMRLSWPDLLYHPFVADGVLVQSDASVSRPLTVAPSPDVLALKRQQVVEKTVTSGESRLLRKAREQKDKTSKQVSAGNGRASSSAARAFPKAKPSTSTSVTTNHLSQDTSQATIDPSPSSKDQASVTSKHRGPISKDYEREFPSVDVGPRLVRRRSQDSHTTLCMQDVDSEEEWEKLALETDPRQQTIPSDHQAVIPQLKNKLLTLKSQLVDGNLEKPRQTRQMLRVLSNLVLTSDPEKSRHVGSEVGLPSCLFDLVHDIVENPVVMKQPCSVAVLGEIIAVLLTFWERHYDWMQAESRLEELAKPFISILNRSLPNRLECLSASVLSMFTYHGFSVDVDMDNLTSTLQNLLLDSDEPQLPLPSGWGLYDGLLSLLLHKLSENENGPLSSSLDPGMLLSLWRRIGTSLEKTLSITDICSANGLYAFLSAMLVIFAKDPYSCAPLFSEKESYCVRTLGLLLDTDCVHRFSEGTRVRPQEDGSLDSLSVLSCHLLCFPFALDLPSETMSRILQLYDSCGIVTGLLQVVKSLPPQLLELPISLWGRLLLCDPVNSVPRLKAAAGSSGFFNFSSNSQPIASRTQTTAARTASSLLSTLLQQDALWDSAVELLTVLSQVTRCCPRPDCFQLHLEPMVLHQALVHPYDRIRAATNNLLGNLDPFMPTALPTLHPGIFNDMINCLHDPCIPVRRAACRALGNWLGFIGETGFKISDEKGNDGTEKSKTRDKNKHGGDQDEMSRWTEEAKRVSTMLLPLITDPDAVTRRHCCAALGNLVSIYGGASWVLEKDMCCPILTAACSDSHHAVRQAAIATLSLYSQQSAIRQVLTSLDAHKKLLQASHNAPPHCAYQHLIDQLSDGPQASLKS
ncbi:serine/threonine-protein kinase 36 [Lampris incognitus]|uniref:serine/threonine-protein kinase 36 n=1 Tax=Lampris incognitus TaxID=2546036 RepID=UPI0024B5432F|nr:serine/threonine-protein kinase 36 [Lampris incognitus]